MQVALYSFATMCRNMLIKIYTEKTLIVSLQSAMSQILSLVVGMTSI